LTLNNFKISTSDIPKSITIREDGPREGFQILSHFVPTADKLKLIQLLSETGIKEIEVTSFVRTDLVPQLADAEELCKLLPLNNNVRYNALYLNTKGFERAKACNALTISGYIQLAASESFLQKNNNISLENALSSLNLWGELLRKHSLPVERLMISTAFGTFDDGKFDAEYTLRITAQALNRLINDEHLKVEEVTFADTVGIANPDQISKLVSLFRERYPTISVGLHLHDTLGSGMANFYAGLLAGVALFDASVGGMGGCPFSKGSAGNIPTEDAALLAAELGIETGIDLRKYVNAAKFAEILAKQPLPGKVKNHSCYQ
jgi:hydroxymethylglutaryl-CoA lyase